MGARREPRPTFSLHVLELDAVTAGASSIAAVTTRLRAIPDSAPLAHTISSTVAAAAKTAAETWLPGHELVAGYGDEGVRAGMLWGGGVATKACAAHGPTRR
jgi:hypothetical protein